MAKEYAVITEAAVSNLIGGRPILQPPRKRKTWCNSRLVGQEDGSTIPILLLIAEAKYGPWDPKTHYPVWKDKDWCNEAFDNVVLVEKALPRVRKQSMYPGVPAGSPEYFKRYRAEHPEAVKKWARSSYERQKEKRAEVKKLEARVRELEAQVSAGSQTPEDTARAQALASILEGE